MAKVRTQIQLDRSDVQKIHGYAERHGLSVSAAIRTLVRQSLGGVGGISLSQWQAFIGAAGCGRDRESRNDVARRHDDFIYGKE